MFKWLTGPPEPTKPIDELQLEAAQDRLKQRGEQFQDAKDELTRMLERMTPKRKERSRGI